MGAPLISNLGFTEVSSPGSLNTKADTKINLPVQLYKLTDHVSGQLTLSSVATHKKIIIDTNGFNIHNSNGTPLNMTTPGSVPIELKGNGTVQSSHRHFILTQGGSSYTGTTTDPDNGSTVLVDTNHTYTDTKINDVRPDPGNSYGSGGGASWRDTFNSSIFIPGDANAGTGPKMNDTYYNTTTGINFGGPGLGNVLRDDFTMTFTHAFMEDGNRTDAGIVGAASLNGTSGSTTVTNYAGTTKTLTVTQHTHTANATIAALYDDISEGDSVTFRTASWFSAFSRVNGGNAGSTTVKIFVDVASGKGCVQLVNGRPSFCQIRDVKCFGIETGRKFTFTNNTDHAVTASGTDELSGFSDTVSAGAATSGTKNSTNGSFTLSFLVPETNDSGTPLAIVDLNEGGALIDSSQHTGITSVKAF